MTVVYHSKTGNTKKMAERIVEGMRMVDGVEARAFSLDAIDEEFVKASGCVVVGTPIYLASMSGAVKTWLESGAMRLGLAGKIAGAFATANYVHGGGSTGIQSVLSHLMVLGTLAYSGGGAFGNPVIHFGPVAVAGDLDSYNEVFVAYGKRMAAKTTELFGK